MKIFLVAVALMLSAGMLQAAPTLAPADSGVVVNDHSGGTELTGCHEDHRPGGVFHCH